MREFLGQQANLLEATLLGHGISIYVCGGKVSHNRIKFQIECQGRSETYISDLLEKIKKHRRTISNALKQKDVQILFDGNYIIVEIQNPEPIPATLMAIMEQYKPLKYTAVLGITETDVSLQARMSSPLAKNILIASSNQENNSKLLRSIAVSLVLSNTPEEIKLLCISRDKVAFDAIIGVPHLVRSRVYQESSASNAVAAIVKTAKDKTDRNPRIIIMIDGIENFPEIAPVLNCEKLHWIVSTCDESKTVEMFDQYPTRLIGKSNLEIEGISFSGLRNEYLAICDTQNPILFTPLHIGEYEARIEIGKANVQTNSVD